MKTNDNYQRVLQVKASPIELFDAITKQIFKWWSENYQGSAREIGDEFTVRFGETFKTMKVSSLEHQKMISWKCIDQHIEMPPGISPLSNKREWIGNTIVWELEAFGSESILKFTHFGLTPNVECWGVCETGWDQTLKSLVSFMETGKGMPFEELDSEHMARAIEHDMNRNKKTH